ncbi:hypothetical protein B0H13DRAFT_1876553 [Mycena leptocephala]|nr:hypothetical protein B0H13DRAFT_1876553 [Mycena leptocephala]
MSKLYVGNLSWNTRTTSSAFAAFGEVTDCIAMKDRDTGRMDQAECAIREMHDKELDGRRLRVNAAGDKPERARRGGYNSGGYGGGGGGGGGDIRPAAMSKTTRPAATASGKSSRPTAVLCPQVLDPWLL